MCDPQTFLKKLAFLIAREGMVAELLADEKLAFKFFLGSAEEPLLKTFAANVGDAYQNDLSFDGTTGKKRSEQVQLTTEIHLYEMLARRDDGPATLRSAKKLLGELLGWMLGGSQGQDTMDRLVTMPGGHPRPAAVNPDGSLVLAICQDSPSNVLGLADIDPWECPTAGFGHLFHEGSYETNIKVPKGPLFEQVRGAFNLPAPDVKLTERGETMAMSPVSRTHMAINREGAAWRLYDLGSSNGTILRRHMKNGASVLIIAGIGKGNERFCPPDFFDAPGDAALLKNRDDVLILKPGTGFAIQEDDEICLGFLLAKKRRRLEIAPLEGSIFLRVLSAS